MHPFYYAAAQLVQGLFTALALVVIADVASPTFNLDSIPELTGSQAVLVLLVIFTISVALGIVMHTVSRGVFHEMKQRWTLTVLSSPAVRSRLAALGTRQPSPGGPTYEELSEEGPERVRKAAALMHGMEYQMMLRAPEAFEALQTYRDQYRMARSFILPSAALAIVLPFWTPVRALDGVGGAIGPLPIIRTQVFLLAVLAAAVCFVAFRERSYRYVAAKALAWVTLEGLDPTGDDD